MQIQYDELRKTINVIDKSGKEYVISCSKGILENVKPKSEGEFKIAKDVLKELSDIIEKASQES